MSAVAVAPRASLAEPGLVERARCGDEQALSELLRWYAPRVRMLARRYFHGGGGDGDDLVQEGMIGVYKAVRRFDRTRGVPFTLYADLCVRRQLISAVRSAARFEHALPADAPELADHERGPHVQLAERPNDPVQVVMARETLAELQRFLDAELSSLERAALQLHVGGLTLQESADHLSTGFKVVDNALQRARRKMDCWAEARLAPADPAQRAPAGPPSGRRGRPAVGHELLATRGASAPPRVLATSAPL